MARRKESRNCSKGPFHVDEVNMFVVVCMIMLKFCNNLMMLRFCNSLIMLRLYNSLYGGYHIPCLRNMKFKIEKLLCFLYIWIKQYTIIKFSWTFNLINVDHYRISLRVMWIAEVKLTPKSKSNNFRRNIEMIWIHSNHYAFNLCTWVCD
jgi:hypothetical protein